MKLPLALSPVPRGKSVLLSSLHINSNRTVVSFTGISFCIRKGRGIPQSQCRQDYNGKHGESRASAFEGVQKGFPVDHKMKDTGYRKGYAAQFVCHNNCRCLDVEKKKNTGGNGQAPRQREKRIDNGSCG